MEIVRVTRVTPQLVAAMGRLVPQLTLWRPPPTASELEQLVGSTASVLLVAGNPHADEAIVGCLTLVQYRLPTGLRARIEDLIVDRGARGNGIGHALGQAALGHARAAGVVSVELTSNPTRQSANRLYRRLGFVQRQTNVYEYGHAQ